MTVLYAQLDSDIDIFDNDSFDELEDRIDDEPSYSWREILWEDVGVRLVRARKKPTSYLPNKHGRSVVERHLLRAKRLGLQADLTQRQWDSLLFHFKSACAYCGAGGDLVLEHMIPISIGGGTTWDNCVPACGTCNSSKSSRDVLVWLAAYMPKQQEEILRRIWAVHGYMRQGIQ